MNRPSEGSIPLLSSEELQENAERHFVERPYNCAESILVAFAEADGRDPTESAVYASAFGQGLAGQGLTCGAITAGLMLLGKYGNEKGLNKKQIRAHGAALFKEFEAEFGHTECFALTGHDCNDPNSSPFDIRSCGKFLRKAVDKIHSVRESPVE